MLGLLAWPVAWPGVSFPSQLRDAKPGRTGTLDALRPSEDADEIDLDDEWGRGTVFESPADGYQLWATHAATLGRDWRAWSEDEGCPQRAVAADTEAPREGTAFCSLDNGGGTTCTDAKEPNNSRSAAVAATGAIADLQICAADEDWFSIAAAGSVKIEFRHADGDLDMEAFDAAGARLSSSAGTSNTEQVAVPAGGFVRVFGFSGARGGYKLIAP